MRTAIMLLGIPITAVFATIIEERTAMRLRSKDINIQDFQGRKEEENG